MGIKVKYVRENSTIGLKNVSPKYTCSKILDEEHIYKCKYLQKKNTNRSTGG